MLRANSIDMSRALNRARFMRLLGGHSKQVFQSGVIR
jgi:hypothetical protein